MNKKKKKTGLKNYGLLMFLIVTIFYLEMIIVTNKAEPLMIEGIFYSLLFSFFYACVITFFIHIMPVKIRKTVGISLITVISLIFGSQLIYYKIFKTYYTVFSAAKGGQVIEFIKDIIYVVGINFHWIILVLLPLILFIVFYRKIAPNNSVKSRIFLMRSIIIVLSGIIVFISAILLLNAGRKDRNSPYELYYKSFQPNMSVANLGLLTTMRLDLKRTVFGFDSGNIMPEITLPAEKTPTGSPSTSITNPEDPSPTEIPHPGYNIMDIDFESLIANESDPIIKNMHQYFASLSPSEKNEYTGMFKGYNLIFLTAEAFSHMAVHPEITPTFYKMVTEGFNFTSFYTPLWGVSTSDGEYVATTGIIPKPGVWSMYHSGSNSMPFTMGNQLRNLGYKTFAYHNHSYNYYNRHISHPNLGYEYKGVGNGLVLENYTWPNSDLEMMESTMDEYIYNEPFHAYYMTVSGHLRYNFIGNYIAMKNKHLVDNLPYTEAGRAYFATQIELDRALEYMLQRLEEEGLAERTLFVMSSDHYPYGLDKKDIDNLEGHDVEQNFELHRNSLIIYAKGMTPKTIDRPYSSLDIIPTISNLLGLEFDSRLLMGNDIFSDRKPLVIFNNKSFITENGRYNAVSRVFVPNEGINVGDDYVENISEIIDRKFYYSAKILEKDYYSLLNN